MNRAARASIRAVTQHVAPGFQGLVVAVEMTPPAVREIECIISIVFITTDK